MYLTAHHIRSDDGNEDVHAFLYKHLGKIPRTQKNRPNLALISTEQPGKLVRQSVILQPGGNSVESYLDMSGEDDIDLLTLEAVFADLLAGIDDDKSFVEYSNQDVAAIFYVSDRVLRSDTTTTKQLEAQRLWTAGRTLFIANKGITALRVLVKPGKNGKIYSLDDDSAERVRRILGLKWQRPHLTISEEVRQDFEQNGGPIYPQIAIVLTGLKESAIEDLGGIEFVDEETNDHLYSKK